jgi:hypothetical protein
MILNGTLSMCVYFGRKEIPGDQVSADLSNLGRSEIPMLPNRYISFL